MFKKIKNMYKGMKGDMEIEKIKKASNLIMIGIGATLLTEYLQNMDFDKAQVLASQVVNYLMGYDINRIIIESEDPLKSRIIGIKDIVKDYAIKVMDNDLELRTMVIYNLRNHKIWGILGIEKPLPSEIDQIDYLLNKYEQGILSLSIDKFLIMANSFCQTRANQYKEP